MPGHLTNVSELESPPILNITTCVKPPTLWLRLITGFEYYLGHIKSIFLPDTSGDNSSVGRLPGGSVLLWQDKSSVGSLSEESVLHWKPSEREEDRGCTQTLKSEVGSLSGESVQWQGLVGSSITLGPVPNHVQEIGRSAGAPRVPGIGQYLEDSELEMDEHIVEVVDNSAWV